MKALIYLLLFFITFNSYGQTNLISDGDFSTTSGAWSTTGNFQYSSLFTTYHSPYGYAYLSDFSGLPANNISGTLYQNFLIPSGTPGITISFWYRITTSETSTTAQYDTCSIRLVNLSTGGSTLVAKLSNLDANTGYIRVTSAFPSIATGVTWRILFSAGNDASLPTVFRIDDVAVTTTPSYSTSCISWTGGTPSLLVDSAMEKLCAYGIIPNNQNSSTLSLPISRLEVARYIGQALVGSSDISFLDNFPTIFPTVQSLSLTDQRFVKLMLFLEYPLSPATLGTDDVAPFSRDYFYTTFSGPMKKSDVIKAMLEAWNLSPTMFWYDPTSTSYNSIICDMLNSNKNSGWVIRANALGLLSGITTPCSSTGAYLNESNLTYSDFYVMLARLIAINPSPIGYDAFFVPNQYYLNNMNGSSNLQKGVFSDYSTNGFSIPSGGIGLEFQHSYHSNLTEIPFLDNDTDVENTYLKPKLQPLGGGWTHSYSTYIKSLGTLGITPSRILIYWPDGEVHSFLPGLNKYETKGITDKLFIDSYNAYSQPQKVRIIKDRTTYTFQNIDPIGYNVLSLVSITDAYGHSLGLQYSAGYTTTSGLAPQLLTKVVDSFSSRSLAFTYWPGTNYLESVTDPIGRMLTFYVNKYNHELDSSSDAKLQNTVYFYYPSGGSDAYRPHLLNGVRKPKGNTITNDFYKRKLTQTSGADYLIQVAAVPDYQSAGSPQYSQVTTTQSGQTINTNYTFDNSGNQVHASTPNQSVSYIYDTSSNRILVERDSTMGFITRYSYDVNGFLSKKVFVDSLFTDSTVNEYTNNTYGEVIDTKDYNDPTGIVTETKDYRNTIGKDSVIVTNEGLGGEIRHQFYYTAGLLTGYVSPTGYQTEYDYNSYGNIQKVVKYPFGGGAFLSEIYSYDGISRTIGHTDYTGVTTGYAYDNNDNVTDVVVDPSGLNLITHYAYDQNDNVTSIVSPKTHTTTLSYNYATDDLIEESDGIDNKSWRYNQDGTLDTFVSKNSVVFKHTYYNSTISPDTTLAGLLYSDGYSFRQYWSNTKNMYRINNTAGKVNMFWYDARQRDKWNKPSLISTQNFFTSSIIDNVTYEYDRMMRPSFIAYPAFGSTNFSFNYNYDWVTKKLASVQDATTFQNYASYSYLKDGSPLTTTYGNGDSIFYHYDSYNRLDSIWAKSHTGILLYAIGATLDNNGNHIRENLLLYYGGVLDTTLPPLIIGDTGSSTYQLRNRILTGNGETFTTDHAGGVTISTPPTVNYTWSIYGQIDTVNRGGIITGYDYDPLGIRRRKDNTYYVVDQQNTGNVVMEATSSCVPINTYLWGSNGLVCRIDPVTDSIFYYHYDFRGSVIAITNQNGNLVQFYKYDPFGKVYKKGGSLTWQNPYQYIGREGVQTDDSDLYYMKARYYQPSTGRFISEDPKWNTNLFVYSNDDPVNNIDPNGEQVNTWALIKNSIIQSAQRANNAFSDPNTYTLAFNLAFILSDNEIASQGIVQDNTIIHGNSLSSPKPTWGYQLYLNDETFLKNGITSELKAESRYTKDYMSDKYMKKQLFPSRRIAYDWEYNQNMTNRGPLNFENYLKK